MIIGNKYVLYNFNMDNFPKLRAFWWRYRVRRREVIMMALISGRAEVCGRIGKVKYMFKMSFLI